MYAIRGATGQFVQYWSITELAPLLDEDEDSWIRQIANCQLKD